MKMDFTAKKTMLQGINGFVVCQYRNGMEVANQFVSEDCFQDFLTESGINSIKVIDTASQHRNAG